MTVEPKTERAIDMLQMAIEYGEACSVYTHLCERGGPQNIINNARTARDRALEALRVAASEDPVGDTVRGDVASLIRSLHERAQQAEATRDAAQARATACEERARRAVAERDEWRGVAEEGARTVQAQFANDDLYDRANAGRSLVAWSLRVLPIEEAPVDPSAGTGDHEREPGRNGE